MKILYYSLGFPGYRTGGMTVFCMDLIEEQAKRGHDVSLMWPGRYTGRGTPKIAESFRAVNETRIGSYEIKNGLPVSLLEGIRDTERFIRPLPQKVFDDFFDRNHFDVLHVHTLMGLPAECLRSAQEHGIRTVYTTHDCFGVCSRYTLFVNGRVCDDHKCLHCYDCNGGAMSIAAVIALQSGMYRALKETRPVRALRARHRRALLAAGDAKVLRDDPEHAGAYLALRNYYLRMLNSFRLIHYNSSLMKETFESFGVHARGRVLQVSHKNVSPSFIRKKTVHSPVNIGFLGPITVRKGYPFLTEVLDRVGRQNNNFVLHVFSETGNDAPYVVRHKPYRYDEQEQIMRELDLVVVPSQFMESFSLVTLEALSYGVPVLVSENVGAKDLIVPGKNGYILREREEWTETILKLLAAPEKLLEMNRWIAENQTICPYPEYVGKIEDLYSEAASV